MANEPLKPDKVEYLEADKVEYLEAEPIERPERPGGQGYGQRQTRPGPAPHVYVVRRGAPDFNCGGCGCLLVICLVMALFDFGLSLMLFLTALCVWLIVRLIFR